MDSTVWGAILLVTAVPFACATVPEKPAEPSAPIVAPAVRP